VSERWVGERWVGERWVGERWFGRWVGERWFGVDDLAAAALTLVTTTRLFSTAQPPSVTMPIFLVEGNIGAGKSTLCQSLAGSATNYNGKLRIVRESVGDQFVASFNRDRRRFAFALQMTQLTKRQAAIEVALAHTDRSSVLDRSLIGDFAFALWNAASGDIDADEWALYCEAAGSRLVLTEDRLSVVYLHDDVASCSMRQERRDETGIPIAYLAGINAAHLVVMATLPAAVSLVELHWGEYAKERTYESALRMIACETPKTLERRQTLKTRALAACNRLDNQQAAAFLLGYLDAQVVA
jgi:predicted ATPase